jgi:hypothetical protein
MGRVIFAAVTALVLFWLLIVYLGSQQFTPTQTQHVTVDNHTTVHANVTVNMPPDFTGIALIILAVAVLLYVICKVALPALHEWKKGN